MATKPPFDFKPKPFTFKPHLPREKLNDATVRRLFSVVVSGNLSEISNFINTNNIGLNLLSPDTNKSVLLEFLEASDNMDSLNRFNVVDFLIKNGAPINEFDIYNNTAVHYAAKKQYYDILKLLLDNGGDPNMTDSLNSSPLHYAVQGYIKPCAPSKKVEPLVPEVDVKDNVNNALLKISNIVVNELVDNKNINAVMHHITETIRDPANYTGNARIQNVVNGLITTIAKKSEEITDKSKLAAELNRDLHNDIAEIDGIVKSVHSDLYTKDLKLGQYEKKDGAEPDSFDIPINGVRTLVQNVKPLEDVKKSMDKSIASMVNRIDSIKTKTGEMYKQLTTALDTLREMDTGLQMLRLYTHGYYYLMDPLIQGFNSAIPMFTPELQNYHVNNFNQNEHKFIYVMGPELDDLIKYGNGVDVDKKAQYGIKYISILPAGTAVPNFDQLLLDKDKYITSTLYDTQSRDQIYNMLYNHLKVHLAKYINLADPAIEDYLDIFITYFIMQFRDMDYQHDRSDPSHNDPAGNYISNNSFPHDAHEAAFLYQHGEIVLNAKSEIPPFSNSFLDVLTATIKYAIDQYKEISDNIDDILDSLNAPNKYTYGIYNRLLKLMYDANKYINFAYVVYTRENQFVNDRLTALNTFFADKFIDNPFKDLINNIVAPTFKSSLSSKYNTVESNLQLVYQNFTQLSESLNSFINDLNIYNAYKITTDTVDAKIINNTIADNVFDNILPQIKTLTDDELRVSDILVNPKGIFHIYMFPNLTDTINYYSNTIRVPGNIVFSQGIYKPANINILFPTTPLAGKIGYNLATLAISKDDRKIGNHVKAVLNNYLYLRNYDLIIQLINAIDASADPKYNDIKNSALIDMGISADIKKYINYSTTVKITQDLLKNYYNYVSFQTAREILINAVGLPKVGSTYQLLSGVIPELVLFKNTPFSLDFTQLARTTVDYLKNIPMPHAFDIIQADTIIVDKATDVKAPEIKEIVMSNYRAGGVADKNCLHADKKVVQLLIDKNAMINIRDKNGNTPLYYAISLQQLDFIDLLVKNSAKIVNIKNNKFISPIEYAVDLYNNHNSILYASDLKTVIKRITDEDYNTFIKNIQTNADFKNNILKFAKNTLPQFNILYNNMLFYFTKQFNSKWSSANLADLTTLLKTAVNKQYADQLDKYYVDDVILADIDQKLPELIKYDTTYSLNDTVNVLEDEKKRINDKISKYNDELTKLQEINHAFHANTDVDAKAYGKEIHNKIRTVTAAITTLTTELTTKTADATNHSSNMTTTNTTTLAKLQTSLAAYKTAKTNGVYNIPDMNTNKTPVALYTYIANIVFNKSGYLYNKLWFDCISNEQQLTNMNNIHILLIQLQNKLLSDLKIRLAASIKSGILVKHNYIMDYKNFQIIDKWYNYIVDKCVKEPDSLPKYYDSQQNLVLYELTNNYVHVLFNTVTISFYNAIKKLVMRYVETITPQQTATLRGHLHTEYIVDTTNELMHNSGVKEYLIGDTSEVKNMVTQYASGKFTSAFVKSKLALKTDKNEVMTENTKDMFDKVKDMLIANKQIPITRESNVAQYYDKYISPYFNKTYDELYNLLAKEKLNYDYYIINNKNYNNIIVKLLEAITK